MDYKLSILFVALGLLIGVGLGAVYSPSETVITEKIVEVPVIETIEVPVEVLTYKNHLDESVDLFLAELDEDDELLTCEGYEFDFDDVSLNRLYDEYRVSFDDEDKTVDFTVKLKYKEDDRETCRQTFDVSVFYEEDEDAEVSY